MGTALGSVPLQIVEVRSIPGNALSFLEVFFRYANIVIHYTEGVKMLIFR